MTLIIGYTLCALVTWFLLIYYTIDDLDGVLNWNDYANMGGVCFLGGAMWPVMLIGAVFSFTARAVHRVKLKGKG